MISLFLLPKWFNHGGMDRMVNGQWSLVYFLIYAYLNVLTQLQILVIILYDYIYFLFFFSEQYAYCYHVFNDDQCIYYWLSGSEDIPNFRSSLHSGWMDCLVFCSQVCNLDFGKVFDGIRSWNYISCHYTVFEWNFFGMFFGYVFKKVLLYVVYIFLSVM